MLLFKFIFLQICKAGQRVNGSQSTAELEIVEIPAIERNKRKIGMIAIQ